MSPLFSFPLVLIGYYEICTHGHSGVTYRLGSGLTKCLAGGKGSLFREPASGTDGGRCPDLVYTCPMALVSLDKGSGVETPDLANMPGNKDGTKFICQAVHFSNDVSKAHPH